MSKKQIHSRLENLFSDLAGDGSDPTEQGAAGGDEAPAGSETLPMEASAAPANLTNKPAYLTGWAWEIDREYRYTYCGLEVSDAMRMNPQSFLGKDCLTYGLQPNYKAALENALNGDTFPVELYVVFDTPQSGCVPVRMHLLSRIEPENSSPAGWRGFSQRIPEETATTPTPAPAPKNGAAHRKSIRPVPVGKEIQKPVGRRSPP